MSRARQLRRVTLQWQPDVHLGAFAAIGKCAPVGGRREDLQNPEISLRRHHADDGPWRVVEPQRASDRSRIAPELALPERVADQRDRRSALRILGRREHAAGDGLDAEQWNQLVRCMQHRHAPRIALSRTQVHLVGDEPAHRGHRPRLPLNVLKVRPGSRLARRPRVAIGLPHNGKPFGLRKRRRREQHGVDDAEDRGVGGNPQRNRRNDHDSEEGSLQE